MKKNLKKIIISPGCISCGTCVAVCPAVFQANGISKIKENINLQEHCNCIKEAVEVCPVGAIELVWDIDDRERLDEI